MKLKLSWHIKRISKENCLKTTTLTLKVNYMISLSLEKEVFPPQTLHQKPLSQTDQTTTEPL